MAAFKDRRKMRFEPPPEPAGEKLAEKRLALTACLLLASWLGEVQFVQEHGTEVMEYIEAHRKSLPRELSDAWTPPERADSLLGFAAYFHVHDYGNIFLLALLRRTASSEPDAPGPPAVDPVAAGIIGELEERVIEIIPWDAEVTSTDRIHMAYRTPVTGVGKRITIYRGFSADLVKRTLDALRSVGADD